jgi:hypothetical protein
VRAIAILVVLATLLGGCSGKEKDGQDGFEIPEDTFEDTDVGSGKGLIRGIVLSLTLVPVEGAKVTVVGLNLTKETDAKGAFQFPDVEPGTYFVTADKPGWTSVQQSVDVVAGDSDPTPMRILIEQIPGTEPRVLSLSQGGVIACSVGTPATFHNCNAPTQEQVSRVFFDVGGRPDYIQTEIAWTSTQPVGDWLYIIQAVCACDGLPGTTSSQRFDEVPDATSVYIVRIGPDYLEDEDVGEDGDAKQVLIDVSASGPEPQTTNGSGAAINQQFTAYATFFYNFEEEPDPRWSFVEHGEYPMP